MLGIVLKIVGIIISGAIGWFAATWLNRKKNVAGTLRIDKSDPSDSYYLFLELDEKVDSIVGKKYVTFKVNRQDYLSQK